jgi:hypothetical protein
LLLGVGGDKSAFALPAHHQVFGGQLVNRFAHRALADAKARGQVHLAGDHVPRLPLATLQALQDQYFDLLVERTEGRGAAWASFLNGSHVVGLWGRSGLHMDEK